MTTKKVCNDDNNVDSDKCNIDYDYTNSANHANCEYSICKRRLTRNDDNHDSSNIV